MASQEQKDLSLQLRMMLGLRQQDLAHLLGCHQPDISQLENFNIQLKEKPAARLKALLEITDNKVGIFKMLCIESFEDRCLHDPSLQ